jgi:hypothetical protein
MANEKMTFEQTTWQQRLEVIADMMRDMSRHTDPQAMVTQSTRVRGALLSNHSQHNLDG